MIRRFTSAQFVPANAGAKAKNPVGSTLFSTPMVALLRHPGHKILRTCCSESARKRLMTREVLTVALKQHQRPCVRGASWFEELLFPHRRVGQGSIHASIPFLKP